MKRENGLISDDDLLKYFRIGWVTVALELVFTILSLLKLGYRIFLIIVNLIPKKKSDEKKTEEVNLND